MVEEEEMDKQVNESGLEPKEEIQELVRRSREAQKQIENYTQEQVDELIRAMVWCVARPGVAEEIAQFTVDETQLGNYEGKFLKIQRKTRATLMDIINEKSWVFVEWPEIIINIIDSPYSIVKISNEGKQKRKLLIKNS